MTTESRGVQRRAKTKDQKSDYGLEGVFSIWGKLVITFFGILLFLYVFKDDENWKLDFLTNLSTEILAMMVALWILNRIESKDNRAIQTLEKKLLREFKKVKQGINCPACGEAHTQVAFYSQTEVETRPFLPPIDDE